MSSAHVNIDTEVNGQEISGDKILYCICRSPDTADGFMIACDHCLEWYHGSCIRMTEEFGNSIDKYYCDTCKASKPGLKTTFKYQQIGKASKLGLKTTFKYQRKGKASWTTQGTQNKIIPNDKDAPIPIIQFGFGTEYPIHSAPSGLNMGDKQPAHISKLGTSKRKGNSIPRKNINRNEFCNQTKSSTPKTNSGQRPFQRIPSSIKTYKGKKTEKRQTFVPQRPQENIHLSAAVIRKKLSAIRRKENLLVNSLEQMDIKTIQLILLIQKSKTATDDIVVVQEVEGENLTRDCKLCGLEVPMKTILQHIESCYKNQEDRMMLTWSNANPDQSEWNIFCNRKMGKQTYCKQLRVLCPHHYNRQCCEDELCGYPVQMNLIEGSGKFCGRIKKDCPVHPNRWEEIFRAEFDLEKYKMLMTLIDLQQNKYELRRKMA